MRDIYYQKENLEKCKYSKCIYKFVGKVSGIIYGGNSRKIRNYLQISNKIFIFYNNKNENKIGYFKTELMQAISPNILMTKKKTSALLSLTSILNIIYQKLNLIKIFIFL